MLLTNVSLENYGLYRDGNTVDLTSSPKKPIVLIGGMNGNGKTTMLEAIMVALYGRSYNGTQLTKKEYNSFIIDKMHRGRGKRVNRSSISISFKFHHNGKEDTYVVKRIWEREGNVTTESLLVKQNGKYIADMDCERWSQFIENLIPLGITKMFFFDGEKIVKITEWNKKGHNLELKKSFELLLGTDLIKQLKTDLEIYLIRKSGKTDPTLVRQYNEQLDEKKKIQNDIDILREELGRKVADSIELVERVKILEDEIRNIGGWYARNRERIVAKQGILLERVREARATLLDTLSEDTPFFLLTRLFQTDIEKCLADDAIRVGNSFAESIMHRNLSKIKEDVKNKKLKEVSKTSEPIIMNILNKLEDMCKCNNKPHFDLSPNDHSTILHILENIPKGIEDLRKKSKHYTDNHKKLVSVELDVKNVPHDDEMGPKVSKLNELNEELGAVKTEIVELEKTIASKESYFKIIRTRSEKLIKSAHQDDKGINAIKIAQHMQNALDLYYSRLKDSKIARLEENLLESIRVLSRKKMINKVSVDRDTFAITTYDVMGEPIPGGLLSMGERQIVGTALLWALAKTSGRPLPFVIDTPMSRLDVNHRSRLFNSFYPFASHQIIILSTDSEINHKEYQMLKNHVSHSYYLAHNEAESATTITEGYFPEEQTIEI